MGAVAAATDDDGRGEGAAMACARAVDAKIDAARDWARASRNACTSLGLAVSSRKDVTIDLKLASDAMLTS